MRQIRSDIGKKTLAVGSGQWLVIIVSLSMTACASYQTIQSTHANVVENLESGDRVKAVLQDGQELNFRIKEIRKTELIGDTRTNVSPGKIVRVSYGDIATLVRVDQDTGKTLGAVIGIPVAIVMIGLAMWAAGP